MNLTNLTHYLYETQYLKQLKHSGWTLVHAPRPDSVAEHALLASQIAFFISESENAETSKVLEMIIFHDNAETRIGDLNKLQTRYIDHKVKTERKALEDQTNFMPENLKTRFLENFDEMENAETLEAQVVKDADYLEQGFQARIFQAGGQTGLERWLENIKKSLKTKTGRKIFQEMMETQPHSWLKNARN